MGLMLQRDRLCRCGNQYLVNPDDFSAAHRVDSDLSLLAGTHPASPTVILRSWSALPDGIRQHQGGAAGGVQFVAVVGLHNLNIRIRGIPRKKKS